MIQIAILGFGVVGSGVAEVIRENDKELSEKLCGEHLNVKYILDRRSFPEHELGDAIGKPGRMVAAITDPSMAGRILELTNVER